MKYKTNINFEICFKIISILTGIYFLTFLSNDIILDDSEFIFGPRGLIHAPYPWSFWQGESGFTRSWPVSFAALWFLTKAFSYNFIYYKIVNIFIHLLNVVLLNQFLKKYISSKTNFLISTIFLIHPMQIESIFWIFQIKTLLSIFFFLLSLFFLRNFLKNTTKKNYYISLILFYISLASKITAVFFPVFAIYLFYKKGKNYIHWVIPFFILSAYVGIQTINGVRFSEVEQYYKNKVYLKQFEPLASDGKEIKNYLIKDNINYLPAMDNDREAFEHYLTQMRIIGFTNAFYIKKFLLIGDNSFFYKHNYFKTIEEYSSYIIAAIFFILFFGLFLASKKHYQIFSLYLIFLLPVSGIVYVPYMKYSLVADHWACLALIPTCVIFIFITEKLIKNNKKRDFFFFFFLGYMAMINFNYLKIFSNKEKLLQHSSLINKTDTTLALEIVNDLYKNKDDKLEATLKTMLQNTFYANSFFFIDQVYEIAYEKGLYDIVEIVLFKKASIFLKDNEMKAYKKTVEELGKFNKESSNYKLLRLLNHSEAIVNLDEEEIQSYFSQ